MNGWLTDLRKTALVALVAQIPLAPMVLNRPYEWAVLEKAPAYLLAGFVLIGIIAVAVAAIPAVFMVALYRSSASLRISSRLRLLALAAALVTIAPLLTYSYRWMRFFFAPALFQQPASAWSLVQLVVTLISGTAYILFLVAIARYRNDSDGRGASDDRLLARTALIGTIVWGVILVCILLTEPYLAFQYPGWRELALERRVDIPSLSSILWERFRDWLLQVTLFVPFYIVHKSFVGAPLTVANSARDATGFDTFENPAD